MSTVTNVLLKLPRAEAHKIAMINADINPRYGQHFSADIGSDCGGSKVMEQSVFPAAFNKFDTDHLLQAVKSIQWDDPDEIQIFVCEQNEDLFRDIWRGSGQ